MKWFILAMIYHTGVVDPQYVLMDSHSFDSKEVCQQFYLTQEGVKQDIMTMYPEQSGHTLVCINEIQLKELKDNETFI